MNNDILQWLMSANDAAKYLAINDLDAFISKAKAGL